MQLTQEQLESARSGEPVRLNESGTDLVVLRADLFDRLQVQVAPAESGWQTWFDKVESCRLLQNGWNGYTAPAPNALSVENSRLFLQVMQLERTEPTRVAASAMGGIAITRRAGNRKVFVEFYNDGRVYSLFSENAGEMQVNPLDANSISYRALIANMRDYLNVECAA